jgi:hypothetical protein
LQILEVRKILALRVVTSKIINRQLGISLPAVRMTGRAACGSPLPFRGRYFAPQKSAINNLRFAVISWLWRLAVRRRAFL